MTAAQFLREVRQIGELRTVFRFPYENIVLTSPDFAGLDQEDRELQVARRLRLTIADLRNVVRNNLFSLHLLTPDEAAREFPRANGHSYGHHWLDAFVEQHVSTSKSPAGEQAHPEVVHFYGYKGGQARSTLAALLSKQLAEDGWKVLSIDADIEAPSLDVLFSRSPRTISGTVLGLVQGAESISPERISPVAGPGYVDFLACRPRSPEFDIDSAALALRTALDPTLIENAAAQLQQFAKENTYDVLILDHRSGLAPATLPWMTVMPGPTVICVRLDEQWRPAEQSIKAILRNYPPNPGVFVSWKPDDENTEAFRQRNYPQIISLLDILADAVASGGQGGDGQEWQYELSFSELEDHWIVWPYDPIFRTYLIPDVASLSGPTQGALAQLRSILNLSSKKLALPSRETPTLSPSGATDVGDLIQTDALRQLKTRGNSISYILGRKGTGKTRLLRELAAEGLGEALIVDPYEISRYGIRSASPELSLAAERFKDSPVMLWWHVLAAALDCGTTAVAPLSKAFSSRVQSGSNAGVIDEVLQKAARGLKRVFMLDGLETAFQARNIFQYVESLFSFLQVVESDSRLNSRIQFKLFLRTDLAQRGYQNIEQQLHGRTIYLSWNTQKIFNFVLSRIARIAWYEEKFSLLVRRIADLRVEILNGSLDTEECEELLLQAFPERVKRNNLATKTFLKTYFADTASDKPEISTSDKLRYYPRIFDKFLEVIANPRPSDLGEFTGPQLDRDGKISQNLIFFAHEAAAADYLEQLRSELNYLINFSEDANQNADKVKRLLAAFDGLKTPFILEEHVKVLATLTNIDPADIRAAMLKMKTLGLFEDRAGYPEEWRVGRLFKSSLRMKYVRY